MGDLFRRRLSWRSCVSLRRERQRERKSESSHLPSKQNSLSQANKQTMSERVQSVCVYASHRWRSLLVTAGWWVLLWQASMGFISGDWLIAWFLFCEWKTAGGPGPCQSSVGSVTLTFPRRDTEHMWGEASESSVTEEWRGKKSAMEAGEGGFGGRTGYWYSSREFPSHFSRTRRSLASALPLSLVVWSCWDFVTSCLNF